MADMHDVVAGILARLPKHEPADNYPLYGDEVLFRDKYNQMERRAIIISHHPYSPIGSLTRNIWTANPIDESGNVEVGNKIGVEQCEIISVKRKGKCTS
ncbi:hypothetical protein [Serratia phage vB_SmaM_Hera]|uniref:Uncharacterized protein n=1 Tax=Serratia phage vB_SmaM_Hera TaxID=2777369 RepID=A0A7T3N9J0_9CAUD|nr:hypothetical protein [Serratia phage vB_SmaM_Hera]